MVPWSYALCLDIFTTTTGLRELRALVRWQSGSLSMGFGNDASYIRAGEEDCRNKCGCARCRYQSIEKSLTILHWERLLPARNNKTSGPSDDASARASCRSWPVHRVFPARWLELEYPFLPRTKTEFAEFSHETSSARLHQGWSNLARRLHSASRQKVGGAWLGEKCSQEILAVWLHPRSLKFGCGQAY